MKQFDGLDGRYGRYGHKLGAICTKQKEGSPGADDFTLDKTLLAGYTRSDG